MRKKLTGVVLSDKNRKTRIVVVDRLVRHHRYKKSVRVRRKFHCHDEKEISRAGDSVVIVETRPMSKLKRWAILQVIGKEE
ncbi:MAG: 30S ribosomal protein S17 [Elusimicrobia bacterium]|nr:30S ribosomal protein S17 [Elusimicrobiota bacterium]